MRILVISDVHSNLTALNAVLKDAGHIDTIWSLGDIVGYGPHPNECISRLNEFEHVAIAGNHDWAVLGKLDLADFNTDARNANLWTRDQLTIESEAYLDSLPETIVTDNFTLAHGSPRHPIWEYLFYVGMARLSFGYYDTSICLVGHTHVPVIFRDVVETHECEVSQHVEGAHVHLDESRYIINPGGVGQPRDGDPRAAYLLLDPEAQEFEHRRVSYDIAKTRESMREAGLPPRLSARLEFGW